jgi:hypothetical protein
MTNDRRLGPNSWRHLNGTVRVRTRRSGLSPRRPRLARYQDRKRSACRVVRIIDHAARLRNLTEECRVIAEIMTEERARQSYLDLLLPMRAGGHRPLPVT